MSNKARASNIAAKTAVTRMLERVGSQRPGLVVLIYHRILDPKESRHDPNVIEATPDQFDAQMSALAKHFNVASPEELRFLVDNPSKIRHLHIGITFDDGYRDNYVHAFPILKSHGLGAFFFLPTYFVGTSRLAWWDQVGSMVRETKKSEITLDYPKRVTIPINKSDLGHSVMKVLHTFTLTANNDQVRFLENVRDACGVESLPETVDTAQFMSWDEAKEMQDGGMAIASHAHSHRILSNLTDEEQLAEVKESYDTLKSKGFKYADCIAYPVGHPYSFSKGTIERAKEVGYKLGFSNYGGVNERGSIDRFDIRRFQMALDHDVNQFRLRLALSGIVHRDFW